MNKRNSIFIILAVMSVAVILRICGIRWGLPNELHFYSYHPDENMVLAAATKVNVLDGQFDPGFYNYGSLYIFIVSISIVIATMTGWVNLNWDDLGANISQVSNLYLTGRITAVLMGIATVYFVYLLGRKAYGRRVGMLATLLMAILPIHVMHSKFMAVDVPSTMLATVALIFAIRLAEGCHLRDYVFAGIFAGLAAGTKYNAGLVLIAPFVMHLYASKTNPVFRLFDLKLLGMAASAIIGFIIGTPGVFINQPQFINDFMYEVNHARTGHGLVFTDTGSGYLFHLVHSLLPGMGLPILILAIAGIVYALKKHKPADIALFSVIAVYYLIIGTAQVRFARYTIFMLPVLTLFAARMTIELYDRLSESKTASGALRKALTAFLVLITGYTLLYSASLNKVMTSRDTRDTSITWIRENITQGTSIGLPMIPWFYTPPFYPDMGIPVVADERLQHAQDFTDYQLVLSSQDEWDGEYLKRESPDYVLISEFEAIDRLRIKDASAVRYYQILADDYGIRQSFSSEPRLFEIKMPMPVKLPHDMSYPSPEIIIYARKGVE
ncbi:MAG: ArnT family glycosyltransferase [Armatimonadota bacterium]